MARFGKKSLERLKTLDLRLQQLLHEAIQIMDLTILEGHRNEESQEDFFNRGLTEVHYPDSKHNLTPSMAVDIAPFPINWEELDRFYFLAGVMMAVAHKNKTPIKFGGDWNQDYRFSSEKFKELVHFELMEYKENK